MGCPTCNAICENKMYDLKFQMLFKFESGRWFNSIIRYDKIKPNGSIINYESEYSCDLGGKYGNRYIMSNTLL